MSKPGPRTVEREHAAGLFRRPEDREPAVRELERLLDRLRADRGEVDRQFGAERPRHQFQRLAEPGAVANRNVVVLAVMFEPLAAQHCAHDLDVLARLPERLPPLLPVPALYHLRPGRAEPEPEPSAREQVERRRGHGGVRRRAARDLHDRRAEADRRRQRTQPGERRDRIDPPRLRRPRRVVAQPFGLPRELDQLERTRSRLRVPHREAQAHPCDATAMTAPTAWAPPTEKLDRVRAFMRERVLPSEQLLDREDDAADALVATLQDEVRALGLWAPHVPPEAGGSGSGFLEYAYLNEEIGRTMWGQLVFGCQAPDAGNAEILHLFGTDEQKERWLHPLVAGDVRSFFSMTEPEVPGSDPTTLRTRAVRDGDDWVIDGHKWFSSGAEGAAFGIVMAVTDPDADPHGPGDADRRAGGDPGRRDRPGNPDDGPPRPELVDPLRGALHGRARAGCEHPWRGRLGFPDRAEAAWAWTHPPRHALARADAARVRADVQLCARARELRRAARRQADRPELDRRQLRRDPGVPARHARRRTQDRCGKRSARRGLGDQVLRGTRSERSDRPRDPGARRARTHGRDAARPDGDAGARRPHLRRPRRGAPAGRRAPHPEDVREGDGWRFA